MSEGKTYNFYNGSQNVEHIDHQENHYHYYGGQKPEVSEEESEVLELLSPLFYGNREEAACFLQRIRGAKPTQVVAEVRMLVGEKKISDLSCHQPLWEILSQNGYYDKTLRNWNDQLKP